MPDAANRLVSRVSPQVTISTSADVTQESAAALAASLRAGKRSARHVVDAHLDRIARLDPKFLAFITLDEDEARAQADRLDALPPSERGPLHGVPVAVKDLIDTAGLRTTYGSALFADHVPAADDLVVVRLRKAGAVIIGKTNTPEFGFGAICQNQLCGPTRNPFDRALTSGGSSGGSAVAVATGMAPLALGTDFGGSVRTPASFCGIVSIRPTPGSIPAPARTLGWDQLATHGVMARNVADCALMLAAVTGHHPDDPTSWVSSRMPPAGAPRLAASVDLGIAPMSAEAKDRFSEAIDHIAGVIDTPSLATPDCAGAPAAFKTLRAAHVRHSFGGLADRFADRMTPTAAWNIAQGDGISAADYLAAEAVRTNLYRKFVAFFTEYDLLVAPAASVLPWSNDTPEVTIIDGEPLSSILDYLTITSAVSLVGFPILTIPAPLFAHPLPFGIQVIARPGEERLLVSFGLQLEAAGFVHKLESKF